MASPCMYLSYPSGGFVQSSANRGSETSLHSYHIILHACHILCTIMCMPGVFRHEPSCWCTTQYFQPNATQSQACIPVPLKWQSCPRQLQRAPTQRGQTTCASEQLQPTASCWAGRPSGWSAAPRHCLHPASASARPLWSPCLPCAQSGRARQSDPT